MKSPHRLRKSDEFNEVFQRGKSLADSSLVLYYLPTDKGAPFRVGISVGKKIGKAVVRNRYKRLIREAVRLNRHHIPAGYDLVIIARQGILGKEFHEIEKSLVKLLKKASLWQEDSMV